MSSWSSSVWECPHESRQYQVQLLTLVHARDGEVTPATSLLDLPPPQSHSAELCCCQIQPSQPLLLLMLRHARTWSTTARINNNIMVTHRRRARHNNSTAVYYITTTTTTKWCCNRCCVDGVIGKCLICLNIVGWNQYHVSFTHLTSLDIF